MAGYSGKPLSATLGIRVGEWVALLHVPGDLYGARTLFAEFGPAARAGASVE